MNTMLKSVVLAGIIIFGGIIAGDYIYDKVSKESAPSLLVSLEPAAGPDTNADAVAAVEEEIAAEETAIEASEEVAETDIEAQGTLDDMASETAALSEDVSADTQSVADEADALIKQVIEIEPAAGDFVKAIDENSPEAEDVQEEDNLTPLDDDTLEQ
jgi:hypothetical protein